jgi:hypothetical protein
MGKGLIAGLTERFRSSPRSEVPVKVAPRPSLETADVISAGTFIQEGKSTAYFPVALKKDTGWSVIDRVQLQGQSTDETTLKEGLTAEGAVKELRKAVDHLPISWLTVDHLPATSKGTLLSLEDAEKQLAPPASAPTRSGTFPKP